MISIMIIIVMIVIRQKKKIKTRNWENNKKTKWLILIEK